MNRNVSKGNAKEKEQEASIKSLELATSLSAHDDPDDRIDHPRLCELSFNQGIIGGGRGGEITRAIIQRGASDFRHPINLSFEWEARASRKEAQRRTCSIFLHREFLIARRFLFSPLA